MNYEQWRKGFTSDAEAAQAAFEGWSNASSGDELESFPEVKWDLWHSKEERRKLEDVNAELRITNEGLRAEVEYHKQGWDASSDVVDALNKKLEEPAEGDFTVVQPGQLDLIKHQALKLFADWLQNRLRQQRVVIDAQELLRLYRARNKPITPEPAKCCGAKYKTRTAPGDPRFPSDTLHD